MPELADVVTFLGLDPGSFGEVEDRSAPQATAEPRHSATDNRVRRVVEFLGIDYTPPVRKPRTPRRPLTPRPPVPVETTAAPVVPDLPEVPHALSVSDPPAIEPEPLRPWRRADDDILYRPARRPRRIRR